jgi:hypothetical protein
VHGPLGDPGIGLGEHGHHALQIAAALGEAAELSLVGRGRHVAAGLGLARLRADRGPLARVRIELGFHPWPRVTRVGGARGRERGGHLVAAWCVPDPPELGLEARAAARLAGLELPRAHAERGGERREPQPAPTRAARVLGERGEQRRHVGPSLVGARP